MCIRLHRMIDREVVGDEKFLIRNGGPDEVASTPPPHLQVMEHILTFASGSKSSSAQKSDSVLFRKNIITAKWTIPSISCTSPCNDSTLTLDQAISLPLVIWTPNQSCS